MAAGAWPNGGCAGGSATGLGLEAARRGLRVPDPVRPVLPAHRRRARSAEVDRVVLERYLADLHAELAGRAAPRRPHRAAQHVPARDPPAPLGRHAAGRPRCCSPTTTPNAPNGRPARWPSRSWPRSSTPTTSTGWTNPAYRLVTADPDPLRAAGHRRAAAAARLRRHSTPTAPPTCATSTTR